MCEKWEGEGNRETGSGMGDNRREAQRTERMNRNMQLQGCRLGAVCVWGLLESPRYLAYESLSELNMDNLAEISNNGEMGLK